MNLRLPITNNKMSAKVYYLKLKETIPPIWTQKLLNTIENFGKLRIIYFQKSLTQNNLFLLSIKIG